MKYLFILILLLILSVSDLTAANGEMSLQKPDEETLTNMKYDREFLISRRDNFIHAEGDLPVKDIVIRGLSRTSPSVVLAETGIETGAAVSSFDPHVFLNRLKRKNIFSEIEVAYIRAGDGAVIEVTIEEKWTLIPIPMFTGTRQGTSYGLFIMESNFLGYGKYLFTGGSVSSDGGTAMLGYIDPSICSTRFRGNLFLSYKNELYHSGDMNDEIYREYRAEKRAARADLGYTFTDDLRWFLSGGYEQGIADRSYDRSLNTPGDEKAWIAGTVARYERLSHYEYLYYGPKIEAYYIQHIPAADGYSRYSTTGYKIDYSFRLSGYDRVSISSNGSRGNRPGIFEESIGGKPGARTLPAEIIAADSYINYTLTYEYPFLKYRWGAVTLLCFWEQGGYETDDSGMNRYYGPGAGTMVYLKRLALPAMGFNIAKNLSTGTAEFSVNVGMSF